MTDEMAEFDHVEDLLPWYASGKLAPAEIERVEKALAEMPELRRRYRVVLEERSAVTALNESLGAPSPHAMEKLFARIESADMQTHAKKRFDLGNWLTGWLPHWQPRTLAFAGAASALVALIEAGLLTSLILHGPKPGVSYETEWGSASPTGQEGEIDRQAPASRGVDARPGTFLLIAIKPEATAAQIEHFLGSYHASIVDGPKPGGLFRIRVSDKALAPDKLRSIAASMRQASGIVRLVTPMP